MKDKITIDDIMSSDPCYTREKIAKYFNGRDYVTITDIAKSNISEHSKLWVLCSLFKCPVVSFREHLIIFNDLCELRSISDANYLSKYKRDNVHRLSKYVVYRKNKACSKYYHMFIWVGFLSYTIGHITKDIEAIFETCVTKSKEKGTECYMK